MEWLKTLMLGGAPMKANTALGLLLAGASLWLLGEEYNKPLRSRAGQLLAFIAGLIGLLTLLEYLLGVNLHLDQLFFRDVSPSVLISAPGRMSLLTAAVLFLFGCALLFERTKSPRYLRYSQLLCLGGSFVLLAFPLGFLVSISFYPHSSAFIGMNLLTPLICLFLTFGMLASRPDTLLVGPLFREGIGAVTLRRLLPAAIIVPLVMTWIRSEGQAAGYFRGALGVAIFVTATFAVFSVLLYLTAISLDRIEAKRHSAEEALRERENLLRAIVETEPECVKLTKRDGELILMNPAGLTLIGAHSLDQVKGHCVFPLVVPEHRAEFQRLTEEVFEGKSGRLDFEVVGLDGKRHWMETSEAPLFDETGQVTAALGITRDITDRKRAEEALRESEERYRVVAETATDAIFSIDGDSTILYANPAAENIFGYSVAEITGQPLTRLMPEYRCKARSGEVSHDPITALEPANRGGVELKGLHKNGIGVPLEVSFGEVVKDGKHTFTCIVRDMTERKRTELALTESEARFRALVEGGLTLICTHAMDGTLLSVNSPAALAWGGAPDELVGKRIQDMMGPSSRDHFTEYLDRIRAKNSDSGVMQVITKSGEKRSWLYRNVLRREEGKDPVVLGCSLDITDLQRSEGERKTIYEIIAAVSTTPNLQELLAAIHQSLSRVLYAENCYIFLCNSTTKECEIPFIVDQFDAVPPPPEAMERTCAAYVYRTGKPMLIGEEEFQSLVTQGEVDLVGAPSPAWLGVPLHGGGEILGVLAVQHYQDPRAYDQRDLQFLASVGDQIGLAIQKKWAEEASKKAEANLLAIFQNTHSAVWSLDRDYRLQAFNKNFSDSLRALFGKEAKVGAALYDLLPPSQWNVSKKLHDRALAGEQFAIEERFEVDGRTDEVETSLNPIRADGR
ncbi:MAG TPA: PAS domain S-box protein [Terriglobia bacterium]|nr:PAS domain S-box protein [Terriglobia bacterium]